MAAAGCHCAVMEGDGMISKIPLGSLIDVIVFVARFDLRDACSPRTSNCAFPGNRLVPTNCPVMTTCKQIDGDCKEII